MGNLLQDFRNRVNSSIRVKTSPASITRFNVSDRLDELSEMLRLPVIVPTDLYYSRQMGIVGTTLYLCIAPDPSIPVSGDVSNTTNWKQIVANFVLEKIVVVFDGETEFTLAEEIAEPDTIMAYLNGQLLEEDIEFEVDPILNKITFIGTDYELEIDDVLQIYYQVN